MKKSLKIVLIIIGVIVGIILLDSIQALVFDNNPIIGIQTRNMKKVGILVDTHHCGNGKHDTVIKGFSYSCNYEGGKYTLVDETKKINDFTCAEALEGFYEDENYTYYWSCIKNKYMIVKYDDGSKELISEALNNNHIDIQILDKFNIDYIKIEQEKLKEDIKFNIIETKNCNFRLNEYYKNNDRTIYTSCLDEIYVIRPNSDAVVTLKYYLENVYQTLDDSIKQLVKDATIDKELKDGGTKIYKKDNYTVILCNTVNGNKDIYIGNEQFKYEQGYCK